jgi:hypothetical protein
MLEQLAAVLLLSTVAVSCATTSTVQPVRRGFHSNMPTSGCRKVPLSTLPATTSLRCGRDNRRSDAQAAAEEFKPRAPSPTGVAILLTRFVIPLTLIKFILSIADGLGHLVDAVPDVLGRRHGIRLVLLNCSPEVAGQVCSRDFINTGLD